MVRIVRKLLGKCATEGLWFFSCWTSEFTTPQQANGSSVLVCWNEIRPNAWVLLAVTCHYVQPAVSSLDRHAEVKTFLSNTLCIAVWCGIWGSHSSVVEGCVALCRHRRFEGSWCWKQVLDCLTLKIRQAPEMMAQRTAVFSLLPFTIFHVLMRKCDGFSGRSRLGRRKETRKASHNCSEWLKLRAYNSEQFRTQQIAWLPVPTELLSLLSPLWRMTVL
jgi:hypothetical protein